MQKTNIYFIDYLRASAICLVVLHHIGYSFMPGNTYTVYLDKLFYFIEKMGVPIFLMISGFLLLYKKWEIKDFFKKRTKRLFFPFIIFSYFYSYFHLFVIKDTEINIINIFLPFLVKQEHHLWYIYMLFSVYIIVPLLSDFISNRNIKDILFYNILWFISTFLLWFIPSNVDFGLYKNFIGIDIPFYTLYYISGYVGYFFLGGLLRKMYDNKLIFNILKIKYIVMLFIAYLFLSILGFFIFDIPSEMVNTYLTLPCIFLSISFFLFVLREEKNIYSSRIINFLLIKISKYSYGIYLIHVFFIFLYSKILAYLEMECIRNKMCFFVLVFTSSILSVHVITKMPKGKYIIG